MRRFIRFFALALCLALCLSGCGSAVGTLEEPTQESTAPDVPTLRPTRPRIALTFDDGPHNVRTQDILAELAKYNFHATFFVVGNRIDGTEYNGSKTIPLILDAGHEIGIHGYTHRTGSEYYYDTCSDEIYRYEIDSTLAAIHEVAPDYNVRLMRPVGGRITQDRVRTSDYSIILWSVDSDDWRHKAPAGDADQINTIVDNIMASLEDGDIVLMHDIYENTYEAVVLLLARLDEAGYDVVTVSELLGEELEPGRSYSQGYPIGK